MLRVFLRYFRDPIKLKIRSVGSEKIFIKSPESETIGFLESEKSGPYRSTTGT